MIAHVLLIEDNEMLGASLIDNLQMENFSVDWVQDGAAGLQAALQNVHDLIILDISLPKKDGFEVLEQLRKNSQIPVLILSAKGNIQDRIRGLELKADDYMQKPFHLKELLLRIQSLLRRAQPKEVELTQVQIGTAQVDFPAQMIKRAEAQEKLTDKETRLLKLLLTHQGQVVSREKILDLVWGYSHYPSTRTVDNMIVKFRKWIEADPTDPQIIISHRGVGYSLQNNSTQKVL